MSVKTTPAQHQSNLRNVYGTFAIEGMIISKDTRRNLDRIGSGQSSYQQVVNELRVKYAKKADYILKVWCLHHGATHVLLDSVSKRKIK